MAENVESSPDQLGEDAALDKEIAQICSILSGWSKRMLNLLNKLDNASDVERPQLLADLELAQRQQQYVVTANQEMKEQREELKKKKTGSGHDAQAAAGGSHHTDVARDAAVPTSTSDTILPQSRCNDSIDRLLHNGIAIGTVVRVTEDGICLSARHCISDRGKCLANLSAFGGPLQYCASFPGHDIVVFRGPPGPHVTVATVTWMHRCLPGNRVQLVAYPQAVDVEMRGRTESAPAWDGGQISKVARDQLLAAANFTTGVPNSSGGAVLFSPELLAGIYTGTIYHEANVGNGTEGSGDGGSSARGGSSSGGGTSSSTTSNASSNSTYFMESDAMNLEADEEEPEAPDTETAAQVSFANIQHKGFMGIFVPAPVLSRCLDLALKWQPDELEVSRRRLLRVYKRRKQV